MMVIYKQQLEALEQIEILDFENRMITYLRQKHHERIELLDKADYRTFVQKSIKKARMYGVEIEDEVRRFIEIMIDLGENFDMDLSIEWAHEILLNSSLPSHEKLATIENRIPQ